MELFIRIFSISGRTGQQGYILKQLLCSAILVSVSMLSGYLQDPFGQHFWL